MSSLHSIILIIKPTIPRRVYVSFRKEMEKSQEMHMYVEDIERVVKDGFVVSSIGWKWAIGEFAYGNLCVSQLRSVLRMSVIRPELESEKREI
jgi:hypothetical protein